MRTRWRFDALAVAGIVLAVAVVFGPAIGFGFVNLDDPLYVDRNAALRAGLSWDGIRWALTTYATGNWHPLTWLTLLLDYEVYGLTPGGYHATNVVLHALAALGLYAALRYATGRRWPAVLVAALFAVHPLRVESVVWIAERKDVLSGVFWMLTLLAYTWYARAPSVGRYLVVALTLATGLMAKPMLVTLPVILALWDLWPLGRIRLRERRGTWRAFASRASALGAEKLPLLALSAGSCVMTLIAQHAGGSIMPVDRMPASIRIGNAAASPVAYLASWLWPVSLSVIYPFRAAGTGSSTGWLAGAALVALTVAIAATVRRRPYLLTGWLWYLVALVPVAGIVQVGSQARADRYTYLPMIGVTVAVAWLAAEALERWRVPRVVPAAAATALLAALMALAASYRNTWRDSFTLFEHAIRVGPANYVARRYLGNSYADRGDLVRAEREFATALEIKPDYPGAHYSLGHLYARLGRLDEAARHLHTALDLGMEVPEVHNDLAVVYLRQDRLDEAERHLEAALRINPSFPQALTNLKLLASRRAAVSAPGAATQPPRLPGSP
jgi:uncharacterized membrane protein